MRANDFDAKRQPAPEGAPDAAAAEGSGPEAAETGGHGGAKLLLVLLLLIPVTAVLEHVVHARGSVVFACAILAMVPLAGFLGRATEEIAIRSTPALGGLLNATFGNAIELLIAAQLLLGDDPDAPKIVRASIVGSLITNLLLLIGASMLAGGLKYKEQRFNRTAAGVSSSLLIIAFAGISIPTLFGAFTGHPDRVPQLSNAVSIVLALVYFAGVVFTFFTHKHLFDTTDEMRETRKPEWSVGRAVAVLAGALIAVAYLAHVLEGSLAEAGKELGLSKIFVGVVVIGAITNVAENLSATTYARKNMIDLSIQIGTSSAIQVLLFVVPLLVWIGWGWGHPLSLQFTLFELGCMFLPVMIMNHLSTDGVCNWLEGIQLIALYALIGIAFYFVA